LIYTFTLDFFATLDQFRVDYRAAVKENEARAIAEEKRLKQEMAKVAAEKAKKDREAARRNRDQPDGTLGRKKEIDDTKENVMEDLLKELSSSGPTNNVRLNNNKIKQFWFKKHQNCLHDDTDLLHLIISDQRYYLSNHLNSIYAIAFINKKRNNYANYALTFIKSDISMSHINDSSHFLIFFETWLFKIHSSGFINYIIRLQT